LQDSLNVAGIDAQREIAASAAGAESIEVARAKAIRRPAVRPRGVGPPKPSSSASPAVEAIAPEGGDMLDTLLAAQDSALAAANVRATALGAALGLSELRATESDSLLHRALRVAQQRCSIAVVIPCQTRIATALGAGVMTLILIRR